MSQLSINCDISKVEKVYCNLMPCAIKYSGQAKVSSYFKPLVKQAEGNLLKSSFRGKPLKGIKFDLNQSINIFATSTIDCDNQTVKPLGHFDDITFWNWDTNPTSNDTFPQALDWFSISEAIHKNVKSDDLKYNHQQISKEINYSVPIPLPSCFSVREIAFHIFQTFNIPVHIQDDLLIKLKQFVEDEIEKEESATFETDQDSFLDQENIQRRSECLLTFDKLLFNKTRLEDNARNSFDDESCFHEMYHKLIHSQFLTEPIVTLDHSYGLAVQELVAKKENDLKQFSDKQSIETERLLKLIGYGITDEDINRLSLKYFKESEMLINEWDQSINNLQATQKREFREWIQKVYQDYCDKEEREDLVGKLENITKSSNMINNEEDWGDEESKPENNMEESFTINLGSQLKSSYNLLLKSIHILDLCDNRFVSRPNPQRIQTAMSLYSNSLSGLILLVDNRINSYTGIKKEFANKCLQSTDFHFPSIEEQLNNIRLKVSKFNEGKKEIVTSPLKPGDFYITKHSNLSQNHVVFHLVTDESIYSSEVNSRHQVILGLRNILKIAHIYDINTLALPLLLIHEISEDITLQWCLKRAELVLKCIKGFMIEMASISPTQEENKILKFIVPKGISNDLFSSLASMVSGIFRLSNPLILRSDDSDK